MFLLRLTLPLLLISCISTGDESGPAAPSKETRVVVRAVSRDAKVIQDAVGGARITIRELPSGRILATGMQKGNSGDTEKIMKNPHARHVALYDTPDAASFTATLSLTRPTLVEIRADGPLGNAQATQSASKTMWLVPGQSIEGDGVVLEIHGFIVDLLSPAEGAGVANQDIAVRAAVRMACGCPTEPGGIWDADTIAVVARLVKADGTVVAEAPMRYAGERNTFAGAIAAAPSGEYELQVIAMQPESANFGLGSRSIHVGG